MQQRAPQIYHKFAAKWRESPPDGAHESMMVEKKETRFQSGERFQSGKRFQSREASDGARIVALRYSPSEQRGVVHVCENRPEKTPSRSTDYILTPAKNLEIANQCSVLLLIDLLLIASILLLLIASRFLSMFTNRLPRYIQRIELIC